MSRTVAVVVSTTFPGRVTYDIIHDADLFGFHTLRLTCSYTKNDWRQSKQG
jgi:hypothetical protein